MYCRCAEGTGHCDIFSGTRWHGALYGGVLLVLHVQSAYICCTRTWYADSTGSVARKFRLSLALRVVSPGVTCAGVHAHGAAAPPWYVSAAQGMLMQTDGDGVLILCSRLLCACARSKHDATSSAVGAASPSRNTGKLLGDGLAAGIPTSATAEKPVPRLPGPPQARRGTQMADGCGSVKGDPWLSYQAQSGFASHVLCVLCGRHCDTKGDQMLSDMKRSF